MLTMILNLLSDGRDCIQALLDVLDPEEDLRLYAKIEAGIRDTEKKRKQEVQEIQGNVKSEC